MRFGIVKRLIVLAVLHCLLALSLHGTLRLVTTVGMVTDVVREVGGERTEVVGLIGSGMDPHLFKPNRGALIELSRADLVVYNGFHLEGRMTDVLERLNERGTPALALAEVLLNSGVVEPLEGGDSVDPHLWMDVRAWRAGVFEVAKFLSLHDPEGAGLYAKNAERYAAKLSELVVYGERVLATVPEEKRVLVTAHDAFSYFGRAHGYEVRGIQGVSTESESGLAEMEALVDLIVERRIESIFAESSVSEKNVRALLEGARAQGHELKFGGVLYSDAMGEPGTYEGTYIGMLDHNITRIARALGGDAPVGGMNGLLRKTP